MRSSSIQQSGVVQQGLRCSHPDASVSLSLCHPDVCIPLNRCSLRFPQRAQVLHFIVHVLSVQKQMPGEAVKDGDARLKQREMNSRVRHLDSKAEDLDPHAAHVGSSHLSHQRGKFISVLVNLLNSQSA